VSLWHCQAACRLAALSDPASRAYYDRKRAEGKNHNAALICLARRRCDVLYAMLRNKTLYQPVTPQAPGEDGPLHDRARSPRRDAIYP
jgi:hypothetical protein